MSRAAREAKSQAASGAVGVIAETLLELHGLLDKFFEENDCAVTDKFDEMWPSHDEIGRDVVNRLRTLADHLASPDNYDGGEQP